jgi:hypothetical protein
LIFARTQRLTSSAIDIPSSSARRAIATPSSGSTKIFIRFMRATSR